MAVKAWWWRGVPNFGDRLTPYLIDFYLDRDAAWDSPRSADVVMVGSVLEQIPVGWRGTVLGAGRLRDGSSVHLDDANVMALRGPLTAKGIRGDYALGDMGLLAGDMIDPQSKRYDLGIVPHWSDSELEHRPEFTRYDPLSINPRGDPLSVIRAIAQCRKIVASSLHGLIVADSLGIPRRFEYTPRFDREGGLFKFKDYSASINTELEVGKLIRASRFHVEKVRDELFDVLRAYKSSLKQSA